MPIATFQAPGGTLHVETTDEGGVAGGRDVRDFARAITALVGALGSELNEADEGTLPGEIVVRFGLTATARGGVAVSLGDDRANLNVEFKWTPGGDAGLVDFE